MLYVSKSVFGSSDKSKAFADGEVSRRSADSSERMSDSRWKSPAVLIDGLLRQQFLVELAAAQEALFAELGRRPHRGGRILRVRDQERSVFRAEEAGRVKGLERRALAADFHVLADRDERRHVRVLRPERSAKRRRRCAASPTVCGGT